MQSKLEAMARRTLAVAVLAAAALIISLTLYFGGKINVAIPLFVIFAAIGAAASVGWIAVTCTECIIQHVDKRVSHRNQAVNNRLDEVSESLAEMRNALSQLAETVTEYGDQRATAARLETLRSLNQTPQIPDSRGVVTRIGRQASR